MIMASGGKIDLFGDEDDGQYSVYQRNGKLYEEITYYYTNKEQAKEKVIDENYKLLIKDLVYS